MNSLLNNQILNKLIRSHNTTSSIATLTTAFNYLFNENIEPSLITKIVGKSIKNPNNDVILMHSELVAAYFNLKICGKIYFQKGWELKEEPHENNWAMIKGLLTPTNNFLILHMQNHFVPIMGYAGFPFYSHPFEKNENRWIFLAEPCPWHHLGSIQELHHSLSPPIWCIRWEALRLAFVRDAKSGIICLTRHHRS